MSTGKIASDRHDTHDGGTASHVIGEKVHDDAHAVHAHWSQVRNAGAAL
jgi:hypothetical protein